MLVLSTVGAASPLSVQRECSPLRCVSANPPRLPRQWPGGPSELINAGCCFGNERLLAAWLGSKVWGAEKTCATRRTASADAELSIHYGSEPIVSASNFGRSSWSDCARYPRRRFRHPDQLETRKVGRLLHLANLYSFTGKRESLQLEQLFFLKGCMIEMIVCYFIHYYLRKLSKNDY